MNVSVGWGRSARPWELGQPFPPLAPGRWALGGQSKSCAHLAIVTAESIRCALGPWPQLAGEVVTAGINYRPVGKGTGGQASRAGWARDPAPTASWSLNPRHLHSR